MDNSGISRGYISLAGIGLSSYPSNRGSGIQTEPLYMLIDISERIKQPFVMSNVYVQLEEQRVSKEKP